MNKEQKTYALAKAHAQAVKEEYNEAEKQFIIDSGYKNADGTIPACIYMIDDDDIFEKLCEEFESYPANNWKELNEAEMELRRAEDALIEFGIGLVPDEKKRATLRKGKAVLKIRKKLIDYAFRLDTSTIRR